MLRLMRLRCCGVREIGELSSLRSPVEQLRAFAREAYPYNSRFRYALFSQARKRSKYGDLFAAFIREERLGTVIETEWKRNPNSGNPLKIFLWTVDHPAVKRWMKRDANLHPRQEVAEVNRVVVGSAAKRSPGGPSAHPWTSRPHR